MDLENTIKEFFIHFPSAKSIISVCIPPFIILIIGYILNYFSDHKNWRIVKKTRNFIYSFKSKWILAAIISSVSTTLINNSISYGIYDNISRIKGEYLLIYTSRTSGDIKAGLVNIDYSYWFGDLTLKGTGYAIDWKRNKVLYNKRNETDIINYTGNIVEESLIYFFEYDKKNHGIGNVDFSNGKEFDVYTQ